MCRQQRIQTSPLGLPPCFFSFQMFQCKTCGLHTSLCKLLRGEFQTEGSPSVNNMDKAETQNLGEHVLL